MKILLILRHAKSSWKDPDLADHDRPLNKRGKQEAAQMGLLVNELKLVPDHILSSTAKRALKTAKAVGEGCEYQGEIEFRKDLYSTSPGAIIQILNAIPDQWERVMIVGHNPELEELVKYLSGEMIPLSTAALAQITFPVISWREVQGEGTGKLIGIWRPAGLT